MRSLMFFAVLFFAAPSHAYVCNGDNLDRRIAKEMLKFLECGGHFEEGKGACLVPENFKLIVPRILPPQGASYNPYELMDADKLRLISVERDLKESDASLGIDVRKVTFDLIRTKLRGMPTRTRFTFLYTMQPAVMQPSYGCATMRTPPENRGKEYLIIGKPKLRQQ